MDEGKGVADEYKIPIDRKWRQNTALTTREDTSWKVDTRLDTNNLGMQGKVGEKKYRWLSGRE